MKDTIELARAAGVHPLAMSEEYLPGLERFAAAFREESAAHIYRLRDEIMRQENEMYLLRQQIERLSLDSIHSCHAECQRPLCKLTRERDALLEALRFIAEHDLRGTSLEVAGHMSHAFVGRARAAVEAVEEGK